MKTTWINNILKNRHKTIPILTFPAIQLLGVSVKELTNDAKLQAQGMKLIANRHPTSASLSYMDLSVEAEAFGSEIRFFDFDVPTVKGPIIKKRDDVFSLSVPKVGLKRDAVCIKAIQKAKELIVDRPVIAGVIGPFSLAGRLMDMTEIMINCYFDPEIVHETIKKTSEYLLNYINALKKAGADGILIAEPAAGLLSPNLCEEFSSNFIKKICQEVKDENFIVIYHNCGNVVPLASSIISIDADIYHFGNAIDIEDMLKIMPSDKIIMGNIDPLLFKNGSIDLIKKTTKSLLDRCHKYHNFIISSGCDIPPTSKWENIDAYFEIIEENFRT